MQLHIRLSEEDADLMRNLSTKHDISSHKLAKGLLSKILEDIKKSNVKIEKEHLKITLEEK